MTTTQTPAGAVEGAAPAGLMRPGSPEWLATITASKVPVILGISRFTSQYELWHQMAGLDQEPPPAPAQQDMYDYGHAVEHAAAAYWLLRNPGWRLSPGEVQYRTDAFGFPAVATIDRRASRGRSRRIVEVKSARSLEEWGDDGSGEIPADYAAQLCFQQMVTGWHAPAELVLWPDYGRPRIYTVDYEPDIAEAIADRCRRWLDSLSAGTPPALDDSVSCYETVRRLHPDIDRDAEAEIDESAALALLEASAADKRVKRQLRGAKTAVLDAVGNAQYVTCNGVRVADRRANSAGSVSLYPRDKAHDELLPTTY